MANDLNRAEFIGNLGAAPDVRYLPSGEPVANFSIACNRQWKDRDSGDKREATDWIRLVVYGGLADVCREYLGKGHRVFVAGRQRTRKWQGQDGQDRFTTEVVVRELQMLGSPSGSGAQTKAEQQAQQYGAPPGEPALGGDDLDDDIPFAAVPDWAI